MRTIRRGVLFGLLVLLAGSFLLNEPLQARAAKNKKVQRKAKKPTNNTKKYDTFTLALMHYHGKLVKRDEAEAARLLNVAAEEGDPRAMFYLGTFYYSGVGIGMDRRKAVYWIHKAAVKGHAQAQYAYGLLLLSGDNVPVDKVQAMDWFGKAAEKGSKGAAATLKELVSLKRMPFDDLTSRTGSFARPDASFSDTSGTTRFAGKGVILDQGAFSLKFSLPDTGEEKTSLSTKTEDKFWNRLQGGKFEIIFPLEK